MMKYAYKPLGMIVGVAGGLLASALFSRVWRAVANEDDAPDAMDRDRGWAEILIAAALHGAVFAGVKAAADRAGAIGYARATGTWPGKSSDDG